MSNKQNDHYNETVMEAQEEPVTKIMAEALKEVHKHWCSTYVDRTDPEYFENKFDYQMRQDSTQR